MLNVRRGLAGVAVMAAALGGTVVVAAPAEAIGFEVTVHRKSCDSWLLRARVTTDAGAPIEGRWMRYRFGGGFIVPRRTNEHGRTKYHFDTPKPPGERHKMWAVLRNASDTATIAQRGPWYKRNKCARDDGIGSVS